MSHEIYDGAPCHNILNVDVCDDVVENMKNLHSRVHGQSEMRCAPHCTTLPLTDLLPVSLWCTMF